MTDQAEAPTTERAHNRVTIGGDEQTIQDFNGFKAVKAMEIVAEANEAYQLVLAEGHKFARSFRETAVTHIERAEARRRYGPQPVMLREPATDSAGELMLDNDGEPMVRVTAERNEDGSVLLGPDPLAHLTEDDWKGSDQRLAIHEDPSRNTVYMHVAPFAFKHARVQVLRLLALVLTANRDLEAWDDSEDDIDTKLDVAGRKLLHDCRADELIRLAVATIDVAREQLRDPFGEIEQGIRSLTSRPATETERPPAAGPMAVEEPSTDESASTGDSPGSPSPSSSADGAGETPSTAPPSQPSSPPVPA